MRCSYAITVIQDIFYQGRCSCGHHTELYIDGLEAVNMLGVHTYRKARADGRSTVDAYGEATRLMNETQMPDTD